MKKSELDPQQIFNFVGYRFDLVSGWVLATQDRWIALQEKLNFIKNWNSCTVGQFMSDRVADSHGKTSLLGHLHMRPFQWHLKRHWHVPEMLEVILVPPSLHPHLDWWLDESNVLGGPTFAPSSTRSSAVQRLGHSLRGLHCKRRLVSHRKSPSHKLLRTEGSPPGPEEIRASLQGPDCSCCDGQYNSGLLHQQAGRYEVRLSVCPPLEAPILVPSQGNCSEGQTHSRSLECDSGQAFQAQSSDPNRVVPISAGVQSFVFQMGPTASRLVCNPVQSQTSSVCITGTGSDSLGSGCLGHVHLSTSLPGSPGGG